MSFFNPASKSDEDAPPSYFFCKDEKENNKLGDFVDNDDSMSVNSDDSDSSDYEPVKNNTPPKPTEEPKRGWEWHLCTMCEPHDYFQRKIVVNPYKNMCRTCYKSPKNSIKCTSCGGGMPKNKYRTICNSCHFPVECLICDKPCRPWGYGGKHQVAKKFFMCKQHLLENFGELFEECGCGEEYFKPPGKKWLKKCVKC